MPESRHKYLYERLGDHDFQQLVGAVLSWRFSDFVPMPLRQADGGRDGLRGEPGAWMVYQVKWSATGAEQNPVSWLEKAIERERATIERLVSKGATRYVLVTNVPSTGREETGTFDRLEERMQQLSVSLSIEMSTMWREGLDGLVAAAPTDLTWSFAEMLAGWDLIRYLIGEEAQVKRDSSLRKILRRVTAAQWADDEKIKFSQTELRDRLTDLYVDVPAERLSRPKYGLEFTDPGLIVGGAAKYLTSEEAPGLVLVRGVPGQGKSTLTQYVSQSYRAAFMGRDADAEGLMRVKLPRFPIRFDLANYAAWLEGVEVFDDSSADRPKRGVKPAAQQCSVECFLAYVMTHTAGTDGINASQVQEIFERVPSVVMMDGLDEVGRASTRRLVVREIEQFCARGDAYAVPPNVVVTTRPNSAGLPEPTLEGLQTSKVLMLQPLTHSLRNEYLEKWCEAHGIRGVESQTLRRNFNARTKEPYIGELAGNPMQLTILLFLLEQNGDATPTQRTELYDFYVNLLLAREANKHPDSVRKHRRDLMEIVPFLGWYLQSRAEEAGHSGRMTKPELEAAMKHFQSAHGKNVRIVDDLFSAATERLWALTGKDEGTYEFEVLSLREYFAAQYLYRNAGEGNRHFDRTEVFGALLRRPFWLNTARFYAGNASGSDIYSLQAGIEQELKRSNSAQVRVAAWTLITDGVFDSRPLIAGGIVDKLTDDNGGRLLVEALGRSEIVPLRDSEHANESWQRISALVAADPLDPETSTRVRVLRELLGQVNQFRIWWLKRLATSVGTETEDVWLRIGAECEVLAGEPIELAGLDAEDGAKAQLILNTGGVPVDGSHLADQLGRAVLDGLCGETTSIRSEAAQASVALTPTGFAFSRDRSDLKSLASRRSQALQRLRQHSSRFAKPAGLRRFGRGEKGTTFPFANTATALLEQFGRVWLVSEWAVVGAASPLRDGYRIHPGTAAFGLNGHPATLIKEARLHRDDQAWWAEQREKCTDSLSRAEWAFAVISLVRGSAMEDLRAEAFATIETLPGRLQKAVDTAIRRLDFELQGPDIGELSRESGAQLGSDRSRVARIEPMAILARKKRWFKVDQLPTYR